MTYYDIKSTYNEMKSSIKNDPIGLNWLCLLIMILDEGGDLRTEEVLKYAGLLDRTNKEIK